MEIYSSSLSLSSLVLMELITLPMATVIFAIYHDSFNTIGFYIELSKISIENISSDAPVIVTVSVDAPPGCNPISKSIITRLDRDAYIKFDLFELSPLRDCWKRYREEVVEMYRKNKLLSTIPSPGFIVAIDIPDFRGGEYYATIVIGPDKYLFTYYESLIRRLIYGSDKAYTLAIDTLLSEPDKVLELPQKIVIKKDQIIFRYIDKKKAVELYEEIIREELGDAINQGMKYSVNCPPQDPLHSLINLPVKCSIHNYLFWDLNSTPPRPIEPPSEWIKRVWKRYDGNPTLYLDPDFAKHVWNEIVSRYTIEYHFPKNSGWSREQVLRYVISATRSITNDSGQRGLIAFSSLTNILNKMNPYSPHIFYTWNNTLGEPSLAKRKISVSIGAIIVNNKRIELTLILLIATPVIYSGASFFGKPILGDYGVVLDIFQSLALPLNFPPLSFRSEFLMIPITFDYLGDYIVIDWYIDEDRDEFIAIPIITFIPGFITEQIHINERRYHDYPWIQSYLYPTELSEINWKGTSDICNSTIIPARPIRFIYLDKNSNVSESIPALTHNLMYSDVANSLLVFYETPSIYNFFLFITGSFVTFDYYHILLVVQVWYTGNNPVPIEWCKKAPSLSYASLYVPLKTYYYVNIGANDTIMFSSSE